MIDGCVAAVCEAFAAGLFDPIDASMNCDIVHAWLACDLPTRQYKTSYAERRPLAFGTIAQAARPSDTSIDDPKKVKMYDVLHHMTSGEATTSCNVRADGSKTVVMTDVGIDSVAQLQEACHRSAQLATELMTAHIFGAATPSRTLIDTIRRLLVTLLFEPVRLEIDVQFFRPVGRDVDAQLQVAARSMGSIGQDERLDVDRLMQKHLASFTVNWFEGVTVLAVDYRHLTNCVLEQCAFLLRNYASFFRADGVTIEPQHTRLSQFKYNAKIAKALDRGRLIGALARTFVRSWHPNEASRVRDAFLVAIDEMSATALDIVESVNGQLFASRDAVVRNIGTARRLVADLEIVPVYAETKQPTPIDMFAEIVNKIKSKY